MTSDLLDTIETILERILGDVRQLKAQHASLPVPQPLRYGPASAQHALDSACAAVGITKPDLYSVNRASDVAAARQVVHYLLHRVTRMGQTQVGKLCKRDHATIGYSTHQIENEIATNWHDAEAIDRIKGIYAMLLANHK